MFKKSRAQTVEEYLEAVPEDRQELIRFLHAFIQQAAPSLKPHFATNMLGYGSFQYENYKKEIVSWPVIALANQKQYVSMYICSLYDGAYLAERFRKELGNVSVGKSCIRFKKIDDIHLPTLKKIIRLAERKPGLTQTRRNAK